METFFFQTPLTVRCLSDSNTARKNWFLRSRPAQRLGDFYNILCSNSLDIYFSFQLFGVESQLIQNPTLFTSLFFQQHLIKVFTIGFYLQTKLRIKRFPVRYQMDFHVHKKKIRGGWGYSLRVFTSFLKKVLSLFSLSPNRISLFPSIVLL